MTYLMVTTKRAFLDGACVVATSVIMLEIHEYNICKNEVHYKVIQLVE